MKKIYKFLFLGLFAICGSGVAQANLILNGNFEDSLNHWSYSSHTTLEEANIVNPNFTPGMTGHYAQLGSEVTKNESKLSQEFSLNKIITVLLSLLIGFSVVQIYLVRLMMSLFPFIVKVDSRSFQ